MNDLIDIAPEVEAAIARGAAVVALESSLIAHGLPYPAGAETARRLESAVRAEGAVPATIAILKGRIRLGLDDAAIELLARGASILKVSRRDLAFALAEGRNGGTTIAGTMICARLAGLSVVATGGIGGVHRGVETSWDISADLEELATTPVTVVCSGAKAILDLEKTLEYLETKGVTVVGYGTDMFPAFFVRGGKLKAPLRLDTPEAVARLMRTSRALGLSGGIVVANPAPAEVALDPAAAEAAISRAMAEATASGIAGKAVTPFLLERVAAFTEGKSVAANRALLESNARLAARIACAYAESAS